MGKFDTYKIDLKALPYGVYEYEYALDNKFFTDIDGPEVPKGRVKAFLALKHSKAITEMNFRLEGQVYVPCDRCLDDMEITVETKNRLFVKFGKEYAEESDEIVVIPADEGAINLAWFLYEFISLAIPMKRVHAPGKCNKSMTTKLKKHTAKSEQDEDEEGGEEMPGGDEGGDAPDPRWEVLKGFIDEDNNDRE
ncbi:MAG: DUF177 domain-containing protein [Tannerellaceae bacterium]|nr:DUF177 domain-containing protein [Tannerellaceae bacterium]